MEITIVFDNLVERGRHLIGGNGLSLLIEIDNSCILFDTGPGRETLQNMYVLGIDAKKINTVVLSHGHYDHTGGLPHIMEELEKPRLICHESFFHPQFRGSRYIGPPVTWEVAKRIYGAESFEGVMKIENGVFTMNMVEKAFPMDVTTNLTDGLEDPFLYETSLVVDGRFLTLITGCSHRGIRNIILHAEKAFGKKVGAVLGGFHLIWKSPEEQKELALFLKEKGIKAIPCHCTGNDGKFAIKTALGDDAKEGSVGMKVKINEEGVHVQRYHS